MLTRGFGHTGWPVSVIGQGTWDMPEHTNKAWQEAQDALKHGIDLGMTHIDTAEMYGNGRAEELIAEAIRGLPRNKLFIVSKVLPTNASYKGTIEACERSLKHLKIDYLDCYLLHWRGSYPLADTFQAFEQLIKDGKIRSLGVSNFDLNDLQEAESLLSNERIACNQVLYNLKERGIERKLIPYCQKQAIAIVGYTPFGRSPIPDKHSSSGVVLSEIAAKYGATIRQIMLAFLTRLPGSFAIPKAARIAHVIENAGAGDLVLKAEDIAKIELAFPAPKSDVPLATL